jgi:hypothetical protein
MVRAKKEKIVVQDSALIKLLRDSNRFKKLEDGWVRDTLVGVEWGPSSDKTMNWDQANKYCAKLGGRLPEVNELQSLVDYTKKEPAINAEIFPDTKSSWYWSGTQHQSWTDSAWCVDVYYGIVGYNDKGIGYCVRPVRASQCG